MTTLIWPRTRTHHLSERQSSQFMADVDRVWLAPGSPRGDAHLLVVASTMPPSEAAEFLLEQMDGGTQVGSLTNRLGAIGIAVGTLTPNRGVPKGVRGIWRSTLPIVLVTGHPPRRVSRAWEVAEQVGYLIYGPRRGESGVSVANIFAGHFAEGLVGI